MKNKKITVIGAGNMGSVLVKGLVEKLKVSPRNIVVIDIDKLKLKKLKKSFKINISSFNSGAVTRADIIILAVKPQSMDLVLKGLSSSISNKQLVISIAAGITTKYIESKLGGRIPVVRTMPNTPLHVGAGITGVYAGKYVKKNHLTIVQKIFCCLGEIVIVKKESLIDAITAVSGSGPAYVFLFIESFLLAGQKLKLSKAMTDVLIMQTVKGAVKLLEESQKSPQKLRQQVTSPGGTTEAALRVFNEKKFHKIIAAAVKAAHKRSRELSR